MKIRVLSDLHLEFAGWRPPPCDEDVVVLAGDIHEGRAGIAWARKYFRDRPIVYVPGNHEYYGRDLDELRNGLRESGRTHNVHVLDGDEVTIGGVRFLGATLWTDFELDGSDPRTVERAMHRCQEGMADFQIIRRWGSTLRPRRHSRNSPRAGCLARAPARSRIPWADGRGHSSRTESPQHRAAVCG